ncbi:hypothetical protein HAX54_045662 [Datura stramonium]|uniref:Uncharacterized protein n=1 Tax=Datura stramonium TaxID=4076 RepID=A0ABS8RQ98_DATST|nr:hypothetical protein [Datura stramonium]
MIFLPRWIASVVDWGEVNMPLGINLEDLAWLETCCSLKLSFSEEIEIAIRKLSSSIMKLDKSRSLLKSTICCLMELQSRLFLTSEIHNILGMLLPFHMYVRAGHLAQQSNKQLSESSVMLMFDQLVSRGQSHDSLWVALLAFHLALITDPQEAFVVLSFASVLYHGNWKEGVKFARRHSDAASVYAPEILDSQGSISDDELVGRVTELQC